MRRLMQSWNATFARLGYKKKKLPRDRYTDYRCSLRIEGLEDRRMMAAVTVSNNNDENNGNTASIAQLIAAPGNDGISLREAIMAANQDSSADEIFFNSSLQNQSILLSHGELTVSEALTINGPGADLLTIDASGNDPDPGVMNGEGSRIFRIYGADTSKVTITGLSLTGGDAQGGGAILHSDVDLELDGLKIFGNAAQGGGGGVSIAGNFGTVVRIRDSVIGHEVGNLGNTTTFALNGNNGGGGIFVIGPGTVYVEQSQILNNSATQASGGGIAVVGATGGSFDAVNPGHFELRDSVVSGNTSTGDGGGLFFSASGSLADFGTTDDVGHLVISRSRISDNKTPYSGGGLALHQTFYNAPAGFYAATITDTTIDANYAYGGGGYYSHYGIGGGGGLYVFATTDSPALISNSTISGNRGLNGGGVYLTSFDTSFNTTRIRHSTIAGNKVGPFVGYGDPFVLDRSKEPQKTAGGGILIKVHGVDGYTIESSQLPSFDHTIIADNEHLFDEPVHEFPEPHSDFEYHYSPDIGVFPLTVGNIEGIQLPNVHDNDSMTEQTPLYVFSAKYTIIEDLGKHYANNIFDFDATSSVMEVNPLLEELDNNGGFTLPDGNVIQTHALKNEPGLVSPAIDAGNPAYSAAPGALVQPGNIGFDERGPNFRRVYDIPTVTRSGLGPIDIGAFELQAEPPCYIPGDYNVNGVVDAADYVLWRNLYGQTYQLLNEGLGVTPGEVTIEDYFVWRANFGRTCDTGATGQSILMMTVSTDASDSDYDFYELSLREALELAADETSHPGEDMIVFAPWVTNITLNSELTIDSDVWIKGSGADVLTIDADGSSSSPRRAFKVNSGKTATIEGLTLTGGYVTGANGGAVLNNGDLTLNSVVVVDNYSSSSGGGVYSGTGLLHIADSSFSENTAASGGAVYTNSNMTDGLVIERTAFFNNDANSSGALRVDGDDEDVGTATILNSTFSGNSALTGEGGAIGTGSLAPPLTIVNSTITANQAQLSGGGIAKHTASDITLHNSIVADNVSVSTSNENIYRTMNSASSYNLIGVGGLGGITGTQGNQINVSDPGLSTLADNGGPTKTHALTSTSPARNAGSSSVANTYELDVDQRGEGFDRIVSTAVDIGAFEYGAGSGSGAFVQALHNNTLSSAATSLVSANQSPNSVNFDRRAFDSFFGRQLPPSRRNQLIAQSVIAGGRTDLTLVTIRGQVPSRGEPSAPRKALNQEDDADGFGDAAAEQYFFLLGSGRLRIAFADV